MLNTNIIMQMVAPYMKNNQLTYEDFEKIFNILSRKEQYEVTDLLASKNIELVDTYMQPQKTEKDEIKIDDNTLDLLYNENIFQDEKYEGTNTQKETIVRTEVKQSNELLIHEIQRGNRQSMQDFCIKNRALVDKYVNKYQMMLGNKLDFDDLEQAGMIGMLKAAEKFDFRGEFSTYAVYWIRQSIFREIMDNGFTIRIPVHMMELILKVARVDAQYADVKDYDKRVSLIAKKINLSSEKVKDILSLRSIYLSMKSLDVPVGEEQDTPLEAMLPTPDEVSVEEQVSAGMLKDAIKDILSTLGKREEQVISLRFGLDDGEPRTLEAIGERFHVTRERIRQIEKKALRRLRHPTRSQYLRDYLN